MGHLEKRGKAHAGGGSNGKRAGISHPTEKSAAVCDGPAYPDSRQAEISHYQACGQSPQKSGWPPCPGEQRKRPAKYEKSGRADRARPHEHFGIPGCNPWISRQLQKRDLFPLIYCVRAGE